MFPDACPLTLLSPSKMVPSVHSGPLTPANASEAAANFPYLQDGPGGREDSPHPTPPPAQGLVWAIESTVLVTVWLGGRWGAAWRSVREDTPSSQERAWAWARGGQRGSRAARQPEGDAARRGQCSRASCKVLWREGAAGGAAQESVLQPKYFPWWIHIAASPGQRFCHRE